MTRTERRGTAPPSPAALAFGVREMSSADVDEVLAIERATYPSPWTRSMFLGELLSLNAIALVAEVVHDLRGEVAGYLMASDQAEVWHILNVCVREPLRRRGVGERLMLELFAQADLEPHRGYTLEVRASNESAIRLYERLGFTHDGVRSRYYSDNGEDAIVMWRRGAPGA
jgi:ribosomal-protein-alanine N-acetyltransferase